MPFSSFSGMEIWSTWWILHIKLPCVPCQESTCRETVGLLSCQLSGSCSCWLSEYYLSLNIKRQLLLNWIKYQKWKQRWFPKSGARTNEIILISDNHKAPFILFSCFLGHAIYLIFCRWYIYMVWHKEQERRHSQFGKRDRINTAQEGAWGMGWLAGFGISEKQLTEKAHILVESFSN